VGRDNDRKITHQLLSWEEQTQLGENKFNLLPFSNRVGQWEKKTKLKTLFPHPPFIPISTSLITSSTFSPLAVQGDGEWGLQSVHHSLSLLLFLFMLFPCSSMGLHSCDTVLHGLLQRESFLQDAVLHKLLQHGPFPWGAIFQERNYLVWVPQEPQFLPENLLLYGLLSMAHGSCQEPCPS